MAIPQWRDFAPLQKLPSTWTDGLERMLANYVSPNLVIDQPTETSLRVRAGTGGNAVALAVAGSPRWIEADVTATHPGGGVSVMTLYAVCTADSFSTGGSPVVESDTTNRAFTLKIGVPSGTGGEALSRPLAEVGWGGSRITWWRPLWAAPTGLWMPGDLKASARATAPDGWLFADGAAVSRTTYAALYNAISTVFGGGDGSTTFNLPDLRGRTPIGPDGAANRLDANDALGQSGGAQKVTLSIGNLPRGTMYVGDPTIAGTAYVRPVSPPIAGDVVAPHNPSGTFFAFSNASAVDKTQPYQVVNWIIKT